ncbi:pilus (MSHA type) biogenesis protein MshL [Geopsychrobacter electrodiphilus]|uniref:pilus (MSHA type) biogenesis protein MshL n=1 Tax=Geopsychrobacter electrodiphilus TaxID=225196 RepID=UPI00036440EF|nr:pilus (MSHA type) biogenesis protein MshL [Geopsychrobacter electrodiphilus]
MKCLGLNIFFILLLLLVSCAPKPRGDEPLKAIDAALVSPKPEVLQPALPPADISAALLPRANAADTDLEPLAAPRFDITADQVDAREFFMGLVKGTNVNMVVHPAVTGKISITLKNTSVEEVLQVVSHVYGYPYVKTGSIYQVMPLGLRAQTFPVDYINMVRKGTSETLVSSGQVSQTKSSNEKNESQKNSSSAGSSIETTSTANFWQELGAALRGIIGSAEGRTVVVQPQASAVVVVAMPEELQAVASYLKIIQTNLQRQVVIEARIIEVTLDDGFQSGINWGALADGGNLAIGQTGGGTIFNNGAAPSAGVLGNLGRDGTLPNALGTAAFGGVFSMALSLNNFKSFIELLQKQGDVQVLSSPRVSTVNNQKAVIKVGSDEFFLTDITTNTTSNTSTNSSVDITLTPFFSGIALDVTPQIDAKGGVILHIHPTVSEVTDQTKHISITGAQGGGDQNMSLPLAKSTVRETDSVIRAESGQIVMIGGLMKDNQVKQEAGVPLLSSLPFVGGLFRHTKSVAQKSELIILLRPQVMISPEDWSRLLGESRNRIQGMSPEFNREWMPSP